jgi:hypothetical protein
VLEALLWRRLGAGPWSNDVRPVAEVLLRELARVYEGTARTRPRARAIEHMLEVLDTQTVERVGSGAPDGTEGKA